MCKHVKKSTCREVQGRQLRFHVQNSSSSVLQGLYNVITHEHVTISGIKKACKALTVWRGTFWKNLRSIFISFHTEQFIEHPEGDQTVTNVSKRVSNMNERMKDLVSLKCDTLYPGPRDSCFLNFLLLVKLRTCARKRRFATCLFSTLRLSRSSLVQRNVKKNLREQGTESINNN